MFLRTRDALSAALKEFDTALPKLSMMRNVGEHIYDYSLDRDQRRYKHIRRQALQVGAWDGTTYAWLGEKLNVDDAYNAALRLYEAVQSALKKLGEIIPSVRA